MATALLDVLHFTVFFGVEKALMLSAAEIFQRLKKHNPAAMRSVSAGNFGKFLSSLGIERKHTASGNYYRVVALV